jgi:hypothetical protein
MFAVPWLGVGLTARYWGATHLDVLRRARGLLAPRWPQGVALEVGCGCGVLACALALQHPTWRVIGVDQSAAAVEAARWLASALGLGARARFVCADATDAGALEAATGHAPIDARVSVGGWLPACGVLERDLRAPPPAGGGAALARCAQAWAATAAQGGVWLMCERVGTLPGARGLLQAAAHGPWRLDWRRSGFVRSGANDASEALPLWTLRANPPRAQAQSQEAQPQAQDAALEARLHRHWTTKHPRLKRRPATDTTWRAQPPFWAATYQTRWGVTLRFADGSLTQLRVGSRGVHLAAQVVRQDGWSYVTDSDPGLAGLRRLCAQIQQSFDIMTVFDPRTGRDVAPLDEDGAFALGLALFNADFAGVEPLEAASAHALGQAVDPPCPTT